MAASFRARRKVCENFPASAPYTAGAISAIAFDAREAAVDANAERVLARFFAVEEPLPVAKPKLRTLGQSLVPEKRAGDFAQALMDLGALICTPQPAGLRQLSVDGGLCGTARGIAERLPLKAERAVRPLRRGAAFVARDAKGAVLLVKRAENGLLGGMLEPPLGPWTENFPSGKDALAQAPFDADWRSARGSCATASPISNWKSKSMRPRSRTRPKVAGQWIAQDAVCSVRRFPPSCARSSRMRWTKADRCLSQARSARRR